MRGSGNLIKKTDNSMKNYNLQNNIEQYTMNQIINSNSSNDNVKDRKKTCSQDQNKKAKAYLSMNSKIKSQNNLSPLSSNLNNLIITNQNYSNTANLKFPFNDNLKNNQKSGKKNLNIKNLNSNIDDNRMSDNIVLSNLTENNKNGSSQVQKNILFNNDNYYKTNVENEKLKQIDCNNIEFLENIYDSELNNSPKNKKNIFWNANSQYNQYNIKDNVREEKSNFVFDSLNQGNILKDEANIRKSIDEKGNKNNYENPFSLCLNDKQIDEAYYFPNENQINKDIINLNQNHMNMNEKKKKLNQFSLTPNKQIHNIHTYVKNTSLQNKNLFGVGIKKKENVKNLNPQIDSNSNNIPTSISNVSPTGTSNYNNCNGSNVNTFNKNYKILNLNQTNSYKHFALNNSNKNPIISLNILGNSNNQNSTNEIKDDIYLSTNTNKSTSPNHYLFNNNQYNKFTFSTNNSENSNNILGNNFQYQVCHTQENVNHQKKDNDIITVMYSNTNPNENDNVILDKINNNTDFSLPKNGLQYEKFSLKNNSLNKIMLSMKTENRHKFNNNNFKKIEKTNLSNKNNSNILSTNHSENNQQITSNFNINMSNTNKSNISINKKSIDLKNNMVQKKAIEAFTKIDDPSDQNKSNNLDDKTKFGKKENQIDDKFSEGKEKNNKNKAQNDNLNNPRIESNNQMDYLKDSNDKIQSLRYSKINDKKIKNNHTPNNIYYTKNFPNVTTSNVKQINRMSREIDKNNLINSYNNKNTYKDKSMNLNNVFKENFLKNVNHVSLGYLNNPLGYINNGIETNKNINNNQQKINNDEVIVNGKISNIAHTLISSNSSQDIKNKNKDEVKNFNLISIQEKVTENIEVKNNNPFFSKGNFQNPITKSFNLNAKQKFKKNSISKNKKRSIEKNNTKSNKMNFANNGLDFMSNKYLNNIYKTNKNKPSQNQNLNSMDINSNFNKRDFCRIFNSDDFIERNVMKNNYNQDDMNALRNIKMNSLYSMNQSSKTGQSKNIQINLYNITNADSIETENLYQVDFNSNLKNKEKTVIIDDIEELQEEFKLNGDINRLPEKKAKEQIDIDNKNCRSKKERNQNECIKEDSIQINNISQKPDILHSILNFRGFFKNSERNTIYNITQSQESMDQLNKLNEKLNNVKLNLDNNFMKKISEIKNDNDTVSIKNSTAKIGSNNSMILADKNIEMTNMIQKNELLINTRTNFVINRNNIANVEIDQNEGNRNYYYFNETISNMKESIKNKDNDLKLCADFKSNLTPKRDIYLNKNEKTNIINEIHFNSDIRMKRYEILLDFINTNMKEIEKLVCDNDSEPPQNLQNVIKPDKKNVEIECSEQKISFINHENNKVNFIKQDDLPFNKNNGYISYVNSLKKIEETNSNKVSSLHSKINLNSRLSNNDLPLDESEIKDDKQITCHQPPIVGNINIQNEVDNPNGKLENSIIIAKCSIKDINLNSNMNNIFTNVNNVNDYESINFYKTKKDPGSSLLISSIYSDFYQDIIDESFNNLNFLNNNNILNLINNNVYGQQPIIPSFNLNLKIDSKPPKLVNGDAENHFKNKNNLMEMNSLNRIEENLINISKKNEQNNNLNNLVGNQNIPNQIFNNIILMNNNFNKFNKQQTINCNLSTLTINDKNTLTESLSKPNLNLNNNHIADTKIKNNLDKNLLTLINNTNNKNNNQPQIQLSDGQTSKNILSKNIEASNTYENINPKEIVPIKAKIENQLNDRIEHIDQNNLDFEHKESTDMHIEKEIIINPIKNIENNMNNINTLNGRLKSYQNNVLLDQIKIENHCLNDNISTKNVSIVEQYNNTLNKKDSASRFTPFNKNYNFIKQYKESLRNSDSDKTIVEFDKNYTQDNRPFKGDHENFNTQNEKLIDEINVAHLTNLYHNIEKTKLKKNNKLYNYNFNESKDFLVDNQVYNKRSKDEEKKEEINEAKIEKKLLDENIKDKSKCLIF